MFEGPSFGKNAKRVVKSAILGAGLLAGEGAVNNIEAQTSSVEQVAQEDSLEILMEQGREKPEVVFEEGDNLYVVVEKVSPDLQISVSMAEAIGRSLFAKYLSDNKQGSIEIAGPRSCKRDIKREGGSFRTTVLMEMPKPKSE